MNEDCPISFPKFFVCLPHYNFDQNPFYFHKFLTVTYPTLEELRARNSDIGPDLKVEMKIDKPEDCLALDVFQIGSYILFSERSLKILNVDFLHTLVDVEIESQNEDILNNNYVRVVIDREYGVVDLKRSDFETKQYGDIIVRNPRKSVFSENVKMYQGIFSDPNFPGVYFCDFEFARKFVVEGLTGLQFYHPMTHPTSRNNLIWLSKRGLERNLAWDGKSKHVGFELVRPF